MSTSLEISEHKLEDIEAERIQLIIKAASPRNTGSSRSILVHNSNEPISVLVARFKQNPGVVVGMLELAQLGGTHHEGVPDKMGEISFYVHPDYRKMRVASTLVDAGIRHVEDKWNLPVCASVIPGTISEWILKIRKFDDVTRFYYANAIKAGINIKTLFLLRSLSRGSF